jgi:hypothetical protein
MIFSDKYLVLPAVCCLVLSQDANAASCRYFARDAQAAIGIQVAGLQRIEREASDRLKGLDSRPFDFLAGEARKLAAIITDPGKLKDEEGLQRCRNRTWPVRRICADAAQMLVDVLDKHVASAKPDYDKPQYAAAMAACETHMTLKPFNSSLRASE